MGNSKGKEYLIPFKTEEINFLDQAILFVIDDLDWEFSIRTGFSINDAKVLSQKLQNFRGHDEVEIPLNEDELLLLHNVLNEVCHGIKIENFEEKLGLKIQQAARLMAFLNPYISD